MRQRIQLTDTNRPIAWSEWTCHDELCESMEVLLQERQHFSAWSLTVGVVKDILFGRSGGYSEEATPVPIPNTAVKLLSADDTWWVTARENRTPPV